MTRRLALTAFGLVLCTPLVAQSRPPFEVAPGVEPAVSQALLSAWDRLPAAHQERLAQLRITLRRAPAFPVPAEAPLAMRLMGRAAHAWFSSADNSLTVATAGVSGPVWEGPAPDASSLRRLLAGLEPVLGVALDDPEDDEALAKAWIAFVERCQTVFGGSWPDAHTAPLGDPAVLTRFLEAGVSASLDGDVALESLLIHELGHAWQLGPQGFSPRIANWAELSGWTEGTQRTPADGSLGGLWANEDPRVLIQLLLGCPRAASATFAPADEARFPTLYARFDPREDFAEAYRLALTDPESLARIAPEKLLALYATGLSMPDEAPWLTLLNPGVDRLLGRTGPSPNTSEALRILRACKPVLEQLDVDAGQATAFTPPADLPAAVVKAWGSRELSVALSDRVLHLSGTRAARDLEAVTAGHRGELDFGVGIQRMRRATGYADFLQDHAGETALTVLTKALSYLDDVQLASWRDHPDLEAHPLRRALVLAASLAADPDRTEYAAALRAIQVDTPYVRSLILERLLAPFVRNPPTRTNLALELAEELLRETPGSTAIAASRARVLALLAWTESSDPSPVRAAVDAIEFPALRDSTHAQVLRILRGAGPPK